MSGAHKSVRVRVTGRVQGVGFRAWTRECATAFALDGWVRNEADGSVMAVFHGASGNIDGMLEAIEEGPPWGRVQSVDVSQTDEPTEDGFVVRRT